MYQSKSVLERTRAILAKSNGDVAKGVDLSEWDVERRNPETVEVNDGEWDTDTPEFLSGTISLIRAEPGDALLKQYEAAILKRDSELALELHERLQSRAEPRLGSEEPASVADLTYEGETVIERLGETTNGSLAVGFASFNGGSLDPDLFEVKEYVDTDEDIEYEYRVFVIPPAQNSAEQDASVSVPDEQSRPALNISPKPAAATIWLAAGVVAGAALVGSGDAREPELPSEERVQSPTLETGESVDQLIKTREQLDA